MQPRLPDRCVLGHVALTSGGPRPLRMAGSRAQELARGTADAPTASAGWWPRLALGIVRRLLRLLFRLRLEGQALPPAPYLLLANHQGWADAFVLLALLPTEPRVYFIADRTATHAVWWKRLVIRSLGVVVAVDRDGSSERGAVEASLGILESGAVLGLFPEGRVSHAEAQLAPFRRGVGYLALKSGVPVVPMWLRGTAELYLGRELVARIGAARIPTPEPPTHDATERLAAQLHDDLAALADPWTEPAGTPKRWRWLTNIL